MQEIDASSVPMQETKAIVTEFDAERIAIQSDIKEYIDLCEQIRAVKQDMKIIQERKRELDDHICAYMVKHNISACQTPQGKILMYQAKVMKPMNKTTAVETLTASGKLDGPTANEICEIVFTKENRESGTTPKIKLNKKGAAPSSVLTVT